MEPFGSTVFDSDDEPIALPKKTEPDYRPDSNRCPGTSSAEPVAVDTAFFSKTTDLSRGKTKRAKSVDDCMELATAFDSTAKKRKLRAEETQTQRMGNDIMACFKQRAEKKADAEKRRRHLLLPVAQSDPPTLASD